MSIATVDSSRTRTTIVAPCAATSTIRWSAPMVVRGADNAPQRLVVSAGVASTMVKIARGFLLPTHIHEVGNSALPVRRFTFGVFDWRLVWRVSFNTSSRVRRSVGRIFRCVEASRD